MGEGAFWVVGVWAVLDVDVFTPAVFGADFLSPLPAVTATGVTFCKWNVDEKSAQNNKHVIG